MLHLEVPYCEETIPICLPDSVSVTVAEPEDIQMEVISSFELIRQALVSPVKSESFEDFLERKGKLLVIVNDGTRPTPTREILTEIADELDEANAEFIIATGVHRAPTDKEYVSIFGEHYERFKDRIFVHDSRKEDELIFIGSSAKDTEMYLNRRGWEAERILVIGSVEPHYFAGYTGGRKAFLPGIAGYKTIEQNHKLALSSKARSLALHGNPVHEDMIDAIKTLSGKSIFSIMSVLDKSHSIYGVTAGDIFGAFDAAVAYAEKLFVADVPEKADIVITCAKPPMDIDLYQSQKAIDNARLVVSEGGILILVSSCRDGVGEEAFHRLLSSCNTPEEVIEKISGEFKLGYHKAAKLAEVFLCSEVWGFTELADETLSGVFIKPIKDLQRAIDAAIGIKGKEARIVIMPDGSVTVPQVSGS